MSSSRHLLRRSVRNRWISCAVYFRQGKNCKKATCPVCRLCVIHSCAQNCEGRPTGTTVHSPNRKRGRRANFKPVPDTGGKRSRSLRRASKEAKKRIASSYQSCPLVNRGGHCRCRSQGGQHGGSTGICTGRNTWTRRGQQW